MKTKISNVVLLATLLLYIMCATSIEHVWADGGGESGKRCVGVGGCFGDSPERQVADVGDVLSVLKDVIDEREW